MSRIIVITGATGKFGKILIRNFLDKGDVVVAISRSKKLLDQLKFGKKSKHQNLYTISVDLMKENSVQRAIKMIKNFGLKPDSLINNARRVLIIFV